MGRAQVRQSEVIQDGRISNFNGIYAAIVIPNATRGPVMEPVLVNSPEDLVRKFSIDGTLKPGSSLAYLHADLYLRRSDKLWVVRPNNTGLSYSAVELNISTALTDTTSAVVTDPEAHVFGADGCILFTSKDPGTWGNRLKIKISEPTTKEFEGQFNIEVYLDSSVVESFKATRVAGIKDGYQRSAYVEDVLVRSSYVSAVDNVAVLPSVMPKTTASAVALSNGSDGVIATTADVINAFELFRSRDKYPVTLLLDGGNEVTSIQQTLISIASSRKDCIALISTPYTEEADPISYITDIIAYKNTLAANSRYAGLYANSIKYFDRYNNRSVFIGSSIAPALSINKAYQERELWYPPAGWELGVINEAEDTLIHFSDGDMDAIVDAGINPIRRTSNGIVIWGQKNLSYPPNLADRMNVTLLLISLIPQLNEYLEGKIFQLNTESLWSSIEDTISAKLEGIVARNGLYAYKVVVDKSNNSASDIDNYTLNVDIYLQPTKGIEEIRERIIITKTGAALG